MESFKIWLENLMPLDQALSTLGFSSIPSEDILKTVYKKTARKYHPDVVGNNQFIDAFKTATNAFEAIKRAIAAPFQQPPKANPKANYSSNSNNLAELKQYGLRISTLFSELLMMRNVDKYEINNTFKKLLNTNANGMYDSNCLLMKFKNIAKNMVEIPDDVKSKFSNLYHRISYFNYNLNSAKMKKEIELIYGLFSEIYKTISLITH